MPIKKLLTDFAQDIIKYWRGEFEDMKNERDNLRVEVDELNRLLAGELSRMSRVEMGKPVPDEKKWPSEDRIDVISQNGPTGDHYE